MPGKGYLENWRKCSRNRALTFINKIVLAEKIVPATTSAQVRHRAKPCCILAPVAGKCENVINVEMIESRYLESMTA
jgi:hypothetical protein